ASREAGQSTRELSDIGAPVVTPALTRVDERSDDDGAAVLDMRAAGAGPFPARPGGVFGGARGFAVRGRCRRAVQRQQIACRPRITFSTASARSTSSRT